MHRPPISGLAAEIGDRVVDELNRQGMSVQELSGATGLSRQAIYKVLWGLVDVRVGSLKRVADALGVRLASLVEGGE